MVYHLYHVTNHDNNIRIIFNFINSKSTIHIIHTKFIKNIVLKKVYKYNTRQYNIIIVVVDL